MSDTHTAEAGGASPKLPPALSLKLPPKAAATAPQAATAVPRPSRVSFYERALQPKMIQTRNWCQSVRAATTLSQCISALGVVMAFASFGFPDSARALSFTSGVLGTLALVISEAISRNSRNSGSDDVVANSTWV